MTNETVFAYTFVGFPNVFEDPSKVDRKTVGYNDPTLFNNGVAQIPSFGGLSAAKPLSSSIRADSKLAEHQPVSTPTSTCRA